MDIRPLFETTTAYPEHISTKEAQQGWTSVENIFLNPEGLYTQPASHLLFVLGKNLTLAQNIEAPYRAYGVRAEDGSRTPVQVQADNYWEARVERIQSIMDGINAA